ncbi:MAG: DUF4003 family protein [Erysipelotrichaceae bacterium]|nr:DUF4003 family protein [Erysipelotrichaceae bacterium]
MNKILENRCDELIRAYGLLKEKEKFEDEHNILAGAGLFMASGKEINTARIEACSRIIDANTGLFSELRGLCKYIIRCKMALSKNPAVYFDDVARIYKELDPGIFTSDGSVAAAMVVADYMNGNEEKLVADTLAIYKEMRKAHSFLTDGDDLPFAALMAASGKDPFEIHERAEAAYELLRGRFKAERDTLQSLSHILSLYDEDLKEMCESISDIGNALKEAGHSLGGSVRAAILGLLMNSGKSETELVEEILEADEYLKQFAPFKGIFGFEKSDRCMYAVLCVQSANESTGKASLSATVSAVVQMAIVARMQEAAIQAATAAATM